MAGCLRAFQVRLECRAVPLAAAGPGAAGGGRLVWLGSFGAVLWLSAPAQAALCLAGPGWPEGLASGGCEAGCEALCCMLLPGPWTGDVAAGPQRRPGVAAGAPLEAGSLPGSQGQGTAWAGACAQPPPLLVSCLCHLSVCLSPLYLLGTASAACSPGPAPLPTPLHALPSTPSSLPFIFIFFFLFFLCAPSRGAVTEEKGPATWE